MIWQIIYSSDTFLVFNIVHIIMMPTIFILQLPMPNELRTEGWVENFILNLSSNLFCVNMNERYIQVLYSVAFSCHLLLTDMTIEKFEVRGLVLVLNK